MSCALAAIPAFAMRMLNVARAHGSIGDFGVGMVSANYDDSVSNRSKFCTWINQL